MDAEDDGVAHGFPGCRPIPVSRNEIGDFEGRFEYWDAQTQTAWVVQRPTSPYHELPGQRLARLTAYIAAKRGSPIESLGTVDLLVRDDQGERQGIMQADQILYLRLNESNRIEEAVEVGHHDLPDVTLEVDLTTDVRARKMGLYESWGFPELWVEVPDRGAPRRPQCRVPQVSGISARPTGSVARRVPAGNGGPIAKGRNAATGPVGRALREFAMRATAALWSLPICPIFPADHALH